MSVDLEEDWDGKTLSTCAIGEMTRPKRLSSSQWKCMSRRDSAAYACVEFLKLLESICCRSYQKLSPPARSFTPTGLPIYQSLPERGYRHERSVITGSESPAHVSMPGVHRVASLLKRWLLGTHQGAVQARQLDYYLDEYTFRFNRRTSRSRGLLFYRLLEQAVATEPVTYRDIVNSPLSGGLKGC